MTDTARPHVIAEFGLEHWHEGELSCGRAPVVDGMLVPGTDLVHIGVLATLADVVAGQPVGGAVTPTTDLGITVVRRRPTAAVELRSRVLKAGATLLVAETLLTAEGDDEPFAVSLVTFVHQRVEVPGRPEQPPLLAEPLAERMGVRHLAPGTTELDPRDDLSNGLHGTVQGGMVALLAEMAALSLMAADGPHLVTQLDVRYLNRIKVGPARATARVLVGATPEPALAVTVVDVGQGGRVAAHVGARCRRL